MKPISSYILEFLLLAVTSAFILAKPLVVSFEYGVRKGWFKFPSMFKGTKAL
jgi:hypothetical protein